MEYSYGPSWILSERIYKWYKTMQSNLWIYYVNTLIRRYPWQFWHGKRSMNQLPCWFWIRMAIDTERHKVVQEISMPLIQFHIQITPAGYCLIWKKTHTETKTFRVLSPVIVASISRLLSCNLDSNLFYFLIFLFPFQLDFHFRKIDAIHFKRIWIVFWSYGL